MNGRVFHSQESISELSVALSPCLCVFWGVRSEKVKKKKKKNSEEWEEECRMKKEKKKKNEEEEEWRMRRRMKNEEREEEEDQNLDLLGIGNWLSSSLNRTEPNL